MNRKQQRWVWQVAAGGAAIVAGVATRQAIKAGWRHFRQADPPENPDAREVTWTDAILWTGLTGAAVGVSRMLITRSVSLGLDEFTDLEAPDDNVPGVEDADA